MTSDPQSRKRPLTPEEAELWLHAMQQAKALRRRDRERAKAAGAASVTQEDGAATPDALPEGKPAKPKQPAPAIPAGQNASRAAVQSPPPLSQFDERQRRKLAKDAELIDARLDLHGMRQREAYGALKSFLRSCAAQGMRHVLVITGKGTVINDMRTRDFFRDERGVLRRLVPEWLAEPELRSVVVSYTASHVRHGGDGALYVRLRKGQ